MSNKKGQVRAKSGGNGIRESRKEVKGRERKK
jgi:hypothetical protein